MDIVEAINKRKTYRGYRTDPISKKVLQDIMKLAIRAPSWANTQPWEFAVVTGKKLDDIRQEFTKRAETDEPNPDLAFPRVFPEPYRSRLPAMRRGPDADKIRDDKELRRERQLMGARMYDCPCVIYIYTERALYTQEEKGLNVLLRELSLCGAGCHERRTEYQRLLLAYFSSSFPEPSTFMTLIFM